MNRLMAHFDTCKDVCDHFGTQTVLIPELKARSDGRGKSVVGFTVKSFRNPNQDLSFGEDGGGGYQFAYDPFWDDGDDYNYDGIDDELEDEEFLAQQRKAMTKFPDIVDKIPDDDAKIIDISKRWVDKLMSDMGICPFTNGPDMAGLPLGKVRYTIERCTSIEGMYARYWKEVALVEESDERDLSTTLLIGPEFCMDHLELFESFSNTLTQPLAGMGLEELLQLVFFHPHWIFRDGGKNRQSPEGAAANYARRSPWPMINILRTSQVRTAQRGIPTGLVYQQNEKTLGKIGSDELECMLRLRDWSPIVDKVNRREMEALRVAQDFQKTGVVDDKDTSLAYDSTPAAHKVDAKEVDEGNLVNVIKQALEKRLGNATTTTTTPTGSSDAVGKIQALSGPETSATLMATDFLLQELDRQASKVVSSPSSSSSSSSSGFYSDDNGPRFNDGDLRVGGADAEMDVLFGGGGIMGNNDNTDAAAAASEDIMGGFGLE